jgi:hypothetical protein
MRSDDTFKNLYDCLLESDELYVMFRGMTGTWEKDKKKFIEEQLKLEGLANVKNVRD